MVVSDGYQLILGDVRTGLINARIPFAGIKWGMRLNDSGPLSADLRPYAEELLKYPIRSLTTTNKQYMAVSYGDAILEAGPILTRPDDETGGMKINGVGVWNIFDRRKNLPGAYLLPGAKVPEAVKKITNKHPGSIARELLRMSMEDNPYGAGGLPIVLPASITGTESRTYKGYNLSWIGDDLRDLAKMVDMRFRPRFVPGDATRIEWVFEHAAVDVLTQAGPDWVWDARVERSGLAGLNVNQDGSGLGAVAWATGSGQETAMKLASARNLALVSAGFPWVEVEESGGSEEDQAVLQSVADRAAADAAQPWDTWTLTVRADGAPRPDGSLTAPRLGEYMPGDWAIVNTPDNHPIIPPGARARVRILSMDGDGGQNVKLTVAPIQGLEGTAPENVYSHALLPSPNLYPSLTLTPRVY